MMKVLGPRVLVKIKDNKENDSVIKTDGGIILPGHLNLTTEEAGELVVEVGDEVTGIKKGDMVVRTPRTGIEVNLPEGRFLFLFTHDIMCIL